MVAASNQFFQHRSNWLQTHRLTVTKHVCIQLKFNRFILSFFPKTCPTMNHHQFPPSNEYNLPKNPRQEFGSHPILLPTVHLPLHSMSNWALSLIVSTFLRSTSHHAVVSAVTASTQTLIPSLSNTPHSNQ